jgi:Tol biopolymer transport system component
MRDTAVRRRELLLAASIAAAIFAASGLPGSAERSSEASPPGTVTPAASKSTELPGIAIGAPSAAEGTLTPLEYPGERHLRNVRQLTFGGENAEAYWSADGTKLIFQSTRPPYACDQIFTLDVTDPKAEPKLVSTGRGRTTCAYFFPDGKRILYSSTHLGGAECPKPPDMSQGYVWALYPEYDIFSADADGKSVRRLTETFGYDAEATVSRDGKKIVFTSARDGDLDVYTMDADGGNVKRLTTAVGYDGGPFFSDDGEWIVYRASHPTEPAAIESFKSLLARHLIRPRFLEVRVMKTDGSGDRPVTSLGVASFAPFFFRGGHDRIIFSSNRNDPRGRNFDLFAVNADESGLEQITFNPTFDGFPMFSPDGKTLVFCSNRHNTRPGDTNVFLADWVP